MSTRKLFVNLPVGDLDASVRFFAALGFAFDPRFTDESATCMTINDDAAVMLLVEGRFRDFTTKAVCDAPTHTETIVCLSADCRADVDDMAARALAAGGRPSTEPMDLGFMYSRSFEDLDGHLWEVLWMDPAAVDA